MQSPIRSRARRCAQSLSLLALAMGAGACEWFSGPEPPLEITGIRVFPTSVTILEGEDYEFLKMAAMSNEGPIQLSEATWESEDPSVAAVGRIRFPPGFSPEVSVRGVSEGETRFVAAWEEFAGYGFVRVTKNGVCSQEVGGIPEVAEETEMSGLCEASTSDVYEGDIDHSWGDESQVPDEAQQEDHTDYRAVGGAFLGTWDASTWTSLEARFAEEGATVVPGDMEPSDGDSYAVGFALTHTAIPLSGSTYLEYALIVDRDGDPGNNYVPEAGFEDHWAQNGDFLYSLTYRPDLSDWSVAAYDLSSDPGSTDPTVPAQVSTTAQAVIAEASVLWFLPFDSNDPEIRVRFTAFEHDGNFGFSAPWSGDTAPPQGDTYRFGDFILF